MLYKNWSFFGFTEAWRWLYIGFDRRLTVGSPSVRSVNWECKGSAFFSYMQILGEEMLKKMIIAAHMQPKCMMGAG